MTQPQIWAIGGGKGGVGKSFISSNLAIALTHKGFNVVLFDGDLGGANLHTCLGVPNPQKGLSQFLSHDAEKLSDVACSTPVRNLKLISGAHDAVGITNLRHTQKMRILKAIKNLDADYVILDLGAGSNFNTLDFFLLADIQILVVIPEPTAVENAYRFIKSGFYRQLRYNAHDKNIKEILYTVMYRDNIAGVRTPNELLTYLSDHGYADFTKEQVTLFCPKLILNQIRNEHDRRIGFAMQQACYKYFGIRFDFAGYMEHSTAVWKSIVQRKPLMMQQENSPIQEGINQICDNLIRNNYLKPDHFPLSV